MECTREFFKRRKPFALHLPDPTPLTGQNANVPYVIVADDAFALKPNIMKPFSGRLSRARRCIENAFGIMSKRF